MIRIVHLISASTIILLGAVHASLTPVLVGRFSMGAIYFASAGLAMILLGFLNLALRNDEGANRVLRLLCHAANIMMTIFAALAVIVIPEPQAYFGLLMLALLTLSALLLKPEEKSAPRV